MIKQFLFKVWCITDNKYESVWDYVEPTVCPIDPTHAIDTTLTTIIEERTPPNSYIENIYDNKGKLLSVIEWTDNTKQIKIKEEILSYDVKKKTRVSSITTNMYDNTGTIIETITENITYDKNKISNINRSIT